MFESSGRETDGLTQLFNTIQVTIGSVRFHSSLMMEVARTSETLVNNYFTRQYIPEDNSELQL
jgi:hypothetical protein